MEINSLYNRACEGDKTAEKELFKQLSARFQYLVQLEIWNLDDGEEIAQEALMAVANKFMDIDIQSSFAAWAGKVLENKILNYFRSKKYKKNRFTEMTEYDDQPVISDPDLRIRILDCLKKICKANNRNARMLNFYYHGFSFEEICEKLSLTRTNAYSVLFRARSMLETCLGKGVVK